MAADHALRRELNRRIRDDLITLGIVQPGPAVTIADGTHANIAYVFTVSPKRADPVPGPWPAPELARYDKIHAERPGVSAPATPPAPAGTALGVLCAVLDHDGQQISATQTRNQALADADHLALLHAIWTAESDLIPNETSVKGGILASLHGRS